MPTNNYDNEKDSAYCRSIEDTRRPRLSLKDINSMRKMQEDKVEEYSDYLTLVSTMYKNNSQE